MASTETSFDGVANLFNEYERSLRGYVRYKVGHINLESVVLAQKQLPLQVIDVNGGSGPDTAWLAGNGHDVMLIEPSSEQLEKAEERFGELPSDARSRIHVREATIDDVLVDPSVPNFDLVLSHGVFMYFEQSEHDRYVRKLFDLAKTGGYVSIMEKGYAGTEARLLQEQAWEKLEQLQRTHQVVNNMGRETFAFTTPEMDKIIRRADGTILRRAGIRVITEQFKTAKIDYFSGEQLETIVRAEYEQGNDPKIFGQGQMLHYIAKKETSTRR